MSADKLYIKRSGRKVHHGDKPVFVSSDIEYKSVITDVIYTVEGLPDTLKIVPIAA